MLRALNPRVPASNHPPGEGHGPRTPARTGPNGQPLGRLSDDFRSFLFDANGSTTNDAVNTFVYDTRGRMVQAVSTAGTTGYQVNALGQRIRKSNSAGDTVFTYDTWGKLIAESDPGGVAKRELIYLGDVPVMVWQ